MRFVSLPLLALLALFAIVALAIALKAKSGGLAATSPKLKAKPFLTPNELEFLGRLETAAPELRFHAQVSMGALLEPATARRDNARSHMSARGTFSQKIVDFVAQHRETGAITAVIELDDRTHDTAKDSKRDAMLRQGGYRVVRWHSKSKPDAAQIRGTLLATVVAAEHAPRGPAGVSAPGSASPGAL